MRLAVMDNMHAQIAATYDANDERRLFRQLEFIRNTYEAHGQPSGEKKPMGTTPLPFQQFSSELKTQFEGVPLAPFRGIDTKKHATAEEYLKANAKMRSTAANSWYKVEKIASWGTEALERLMEYAKPPANDPSKKGKEAKAE